MANELEQYDGGFDPANSTRFFNLEDLALGNYEFLIEKSGLERTQKTQELVAKIEVRVHKGPSLIGGKIDHTWFFRTPAAVDNFGQDLVLLGLPAHEWQAKYGKKFSVEVPKAMPLLVGRVFHATVKESPSKDNTRVYRNLNIVGLVGKTAPPPAAPMPGAAQSAPVKDDFAF